MRGRPAKPIERQIVEGDPRRKGPKKLRAELESQPQARKGLPECPKYLRGIARETWDFYIPELEIMDAAYRPDAKTLEGLCVAYARTRQADDMIARFKLQDVKLDGGKMLRRLQASSKESWELFLKFADRFGLSPRSRIGLAVENPNHGDTDLMELLSTPRVRKIPPPKAIV